MRTPCYAEKGIICFEREHSARVTVSTLVALPRGFTVLTAYSIAIVMVGTASDIIVGYYSRELVCGP